MVGYVCFLQCCYIPLSESIGEHRVLALFKNKKKWHVPTSETSALTPPLLVLQSLEKVCLRGKVSTKKGEAVSKTA